MISLILKQIRVYQWVKNFLILAPLLFSGNLFNITTIFYSIFTFFAFSFAASSIYVLNDIRDVESDRKHPVKRDRPLASGRFPMGVAVACALLCIISSVSILLYIGDSILAAIIASYCILNVLYSLYLKHVSIVDCIVIAIGFELRILAGCEAIHVRPSDFILVVTFFLALLLAFIKRKGELNVLDEHANGHRRALSNYSVKLLDIYIFSCATMTLISYMFYTIDANVVKQIGSDNLKYSLVFVVYGLFRFIQLADIDKYQGEGDPTTLLFRDFALQSTITLFLVYVVFCFYF